METPNNWEGRENERLSRYDEGNEPVQDNRKTTDYSLSEAENQYTNETRFQPSEPQTDEERYSNSYGSNSDSSRTMLTEGNEMVFGNDHEGQDYDNAWEAAQHDERIETYEEERRRLERERDNGFNTTL